jgi:hypothetical protein
MPRLHWLYVAVIAFCLMSGCKSGTAGKVVSVSVSPAAANVAIDHTQQFTATLTDTFNRNVVWSVAGGAANGTISSTGLYTAPGAVPIPAQVTITAVSDEDPRASATAIVTVTATVVANITVTVSPTAPNVANFGTQQFNATVNGSSNTAVTWEVNGVVGGSQAFGFISGSGLYLAPGSAPALAGSTTTLTVTAVSQADSSRSASAVVTIVPGNQSAQTTPIELGTSGSNSNDFSTSGNITSCCGGTLGSLVKTANGTQYLLSNNHVLARTDLGIVTSGSATGDNITQPGNIDSNCGHTATTVVGHLSAFYSLETGTAPKIDAAVAQVVSGTVDISGNILFLGDHAATNNVPVAGQVGPVVPPTVGLTVAKSGRTTGLTCSSIDAINVTTTVQYQKGCGTGTTFDETFIDEVSVTGGDFSAEGDSGSLIVSQANAGPVALLFAGSDTDTVGNPVSDVLNYFTGALGSNVSFAGNTSRSTAVIGCSLPNAPQSASQTVSAAALKQDVLKKATAVRDAHASELLANPAVQALGVGASYDNPSEPAILFFVTKGITRGALPMEVDGIRTRILEAPLFPNRGVVTLAESARNEQVVGPSPAVYGISQEEYTRAKSVQTVHVNELMTQRGVQGVGITSSIDSPGEAALMIFLIRGAEQDPIPPVIDGLRTRVRESTRFRAGYGAGAHARSSCRVPGASAKIAPPRVDAKSVVSQ